MLSKLEDADGMLFEVPVAVAGREKPWDCPKVNPFDGAVKADEEVVSVPTELKGFAAGCGRLGEPTRVLRSRAALILR